MNLLDDLDFIKIIDKYSMLDYLVNFDRQCREALTLSFDTKGMQVINNYKNIVISGMGGSGIVGDIAKAVLQDFISIPIEVVKNYRLPDYINKDSLVFIVSYSGNTKETLSCLYQAKEKKSNIIIITSGGSMQELAKESIRLIKIPEGMPPRAALGYLLFPILTTLDKIFRLNIENLLEDSISLLSQLIPQELSCYVETDKNIAKNIALKLYSKIPIIYGIEQETAVAALRWRTQINENAKTYAINSTLPEGFHNEIVSWENTQTQLYKHFIAVLLLKDDLSDIIRKGLEVKKSLMKDRVHQIIEISARGKNNKLANILSLILIGDFVSLYLALLNRIDPSPIKSIEYLKSKL